MIENYKKHVNLLIWITTLVLIGSFIGFLTKPETNTWYMLLQKSSLTPPGYVFGVVWTILYGLIGVAGAKIWESNSVENISGLKKLYISQLLLNWSWSPIFFTYHLTGLAFCVLIFMILFVFLLIYNALFTLKSVAFLMAPYFLWILFAGYLNFYIWVYN